MHLWPKTLEQTKNKSENESKGKRQDNYRAQIKIVIVYALGSVARAHAHTTQPVQKEFARPMLTRMVEWNGGAKRSERESTRVKIP